MAWNTPGSDNSGNDRGRAPRRRSGGNGVDDVLDRLRGLFGGQGGGAGGVGRWVLLVLAVWLAFNSFLLVNEQQKAVVLRFGQFSRILQPGPHFKLPWPFETAIKVNATEIKTFGTVVPVLTRDENIVQVEINVQYRVNDAQKYVFGSRDANAMLQQASLSSVREQVGRSTLDTVLGARNALAVSAREQLQNSLDAYRTGLVVTELNLPNARPPEEVKPAFDDVNSAQQDKDRLISEAEAYAAQVVPEARGQAARVRTVAEGYRDASVSRAEGDADRFSMLVEQYKIAPEVTRKRLWLETVQQVLSDNRKIVGGDSRQLIYVPMDGAGSGSGRTSSSSAGTSSAPLMTPEMLSPDTSTVIPPVSRSERTARPTARPEVTK